ILVITITRPRERPPASPEHAPPARDPAPGVGRRTLGRRDPQELRRRHLRRRLAAPAGAGGSGPGRQPQRGTPALLPRAQGRARRASRMARVHVGLGPRTPGARGRARGRAPGAARAPQTKPSEEDLHEEEENAMKSILGKLEFTIARELVIRAPRATVFRYFTDSERWAKWWGAGSTIEGKVGGAVKIVYPGATVASGEVLEIQPPERIVFSYGYEGAGKPIAPGGSRVTIRLAEHAQGTKLTFLHEVADGPTRDQHVQGWRYQLAVFANVVASEAHAGAAALADRWFAAWNEADAGARSKAFAALVAQDVLFADAYSCTRGLDDLDAHVSGA